MSSIDHARQLAIGILTHPLCAECSSATPPRPTAVTPPARTVRRRMRRTPKWQRR